MIYIAVIQSYRLPTLSNAVSHIPNSWITEIKQDSHHGIPVSYVAIKLDELPLSELAERDLPILAQFEDLRLCPDCLRKDLVINVLPPQNKSGYCLKHRKYRKFK